MDAQQVFKSMFNALINDSILVFTDKLFYSIVATDHALSKADFSKGTDIYTLPSNLNFNLRNTLGYDNKFSDIYHRKFMKSWWPVTQPAAHVAPEKQSMN